MLVQDSGYGQSVARGRETTSCPSPFAFLFRFRSHCFGMSEPEEHVCELVLEDNSLGGHQGVTATGMSDQDGSGS